MLLDQSTPLLLVRLAVRYELEADLGTDGLRCLSLLLDRSTRASGVFVFAGV